MKKVKSISNSFMFCLKYPFNVAPIKYFLYLILSIMNAILPAIKIIIWKLVLDTLQGTEIESLNIQIVIFYFASLVMVSVGIGLAQNIKGFIASSIIDKAQLNIDVRIMNKFTKLEAAFYDNPANRDSLDLVKNSKMMICEGILWPVTVIQNAVMFISVLTVFLYISPVLAIIYLLTAIPQVLSTARLEKRLDQEEIETMPEARKRDYYRDTLTDKIYAKETRIYNSKSFLFMRYKNAWSELIARKNKIYNEQFRKIYRNEFIHALGSVAIIISSIVQAFQGFFSIGDISVVLNATKSSYEAFNAFFGTLAQFTNIISHRINLFLAFLSAKETIKNGDLKCEDGIKEIEFRDVSFRYPFSSKSTLTNISFIIKSGTKNALVGKNGEGKTTIIKLLLRLYDATEGSILINGIDIKKYDMVDIWRAFSLCFQDITKYALTFIENITLSNTHNHDEVNDALKFAGIYEIAKAFPHDLSTELTREFTEEGQELSGGQWQKLSIARTMYKDAEILILDEPSSSLDPIEEDRIMDLLTDMGKDKTTVVVSHRLSDLRTYEQIIVINNGTVVEIGTHNELLANKAIYEHMYKLQSEKYFYEGGTL